MQLKSFRIAKSPRGPDRVRLLGEVAYDDRVGSEVYWFDVPESCAGFLSESGNPWLVCLAPLAATIGEPLRIGQPVDCLLLANVRELLRIWKCWYPHLTAVPIEAELSDTGYQEGGVARSAAFFSGGMDSFFTVLHNGEKSETGTRIDDLLSVWGFDIPLENSAAFLRMQSVLRTAARDLGKDLIDVATNLRETRWGQTDWAYLSHNCALASVGLALENRYSKVLIASTGGYKDLLPWGSHVLTDPLLSTSRTRIVHDGPAFTFTEKAEVVSGSEVALRSLRVCWKSMADWNCCACNKCYRTMIALDLCGALPRCHTFTRERVDTRDIRRIYCAEYYDVDYYREIEALAIRKGRPEIARAIAESLRKSARLRRGLRILRRIGAGRIGRWFAMRLERAVLRGNIT